MRHHFSEQELEQIQDAVARAEAFTSGEIVPYIVPESGRYDVAIWRGASILAVLSLAIIMLIFQFYSGWGLLWLFTGWGVALTVLLSGTLGAALSWGVPAIKRLLAGKENMARQVHLSALEAFLDEEVFNTRDRTGILLFISMFEQRVEVIGDTGINQRVTADDWAEVIEHVQEGVRNRNITKGIVEALELCGALLKKSGVHIREDDINELPNALRFRGSSGRTDDDRGYSSNPEEQD